VVFHGITKARRRNGGLLVQIARLALGSRRKNERCNNPLMCAVFKDDRKAFIMDFEKNDFVNIKIRNSIIKKLKVFFCNFFDFINQPEVRIMKIIKKEKNKERRLSQGKEVLPDYNKLIISGNLKSYFDKLSIGENLRNKIVVRGHFMRFWDKSRFSRLYNLLEEGNLPRKYYIDDKIRKNDRIIAFHKKPFIRGEGILIKKNYELKKLN